MNLFVNRSEDLWNTNKRFSEKRYSEKYTLLDIKSQLQKLSSDNAEQKEQAVKDFGIMLP